MISIMFLYLVTTIKKRKAVISVNQKLTSVWKVEEAPVHYIYIYIYIYIYNVDKTVKIWNHS
jgi:hypothetical protein